MNPINHPDWAANQDVLKKSMEQEISLMREILSNMIQEEASLLHQNKSFWETLMQNRFHLIENIKILRNTRMKATSKLLDLSDEKTFEKLIAEGGDIADEVVFLLDQLVALSEKINTQNIRNQKLLENSQHFIAIPPAIGYSTQLPHPSTGKGRKQFLMTIP